MSRLRTSQSLAVVARVRQVQLQAAQWRLAQATTALRSRREDAASQRAVLAEHAAGWARGTQGGAIDLTVTRVWAQAVSEALERVGLAEQEVALAEGDRARRQAQVLADEGRSQAAGKVRAAADRHLARWREEGALADVADHFTRRGGGR
jgi:hypothetical protein